MTAPGRRFGGGTGTALLVVAVVALLAAAGVVLLAVAGGDEVAAPDGGSPDGGDQVDGEVVEGSTSTSASTGSVASSSTTTTTAGASTSTIEITTDTVEADEETEAEDEAAPDEDRTDGQAEPTEDGTDGQTENGADRDPDADPDPETETDPGDGGTDQTASTLPPPTDGTCRIATSRFDDQSGVVELGADGACGALTATIQAVNPRDDLADTDWGQDLRVCQRHPAATQVSVGVVIGGAAVELTGGLNRTEAEAAAAPLEAITIAFDDQATPVTGPRPVVQCRTDSAELSIVHRPAD